MSLSTDDAAKLLGFDSWRDHQVEAFAAWQAQASPQRLCLYHRTGAGKTTTALVLMALAGAQDVLVIAPPSTHDRWREDARRLGLSITTISHAKFRQKTFKVSRTQAIIADEFHLFGGHSGIGWKKFDRLAGNLQAPIVLASATPNYNDADRVYCIQHVLDPRSCPGGFLQFLYQNCETRQNQFSITPDVIGFRNFSSAAEYLDSLPGVHFLPDTTQLIIREKWALSECLPLLDKWGLNPETGRLVASQMEEKHVRNYRNYVDSDKKLRHVVRNLFRGLYEYEANSNFLVFCASKKIAEVLYQFCIEEGYSSFFVHGQLTQANKLQILQDFKSTAAASRGHILIGTATLATGTDGLDLVCDTLILFDDTEDASLRRQVIGRILPRSDATAIENKQVFRVSFH